MKRPSSEEWQIAVGQWFIIDACCESIVSWVFIDMCWTVTNWSSLEVAYGIDKSMCKQTFNTLAQMEVIKNIEPIWNVYKINKTLILDSF